MGKISVNGKAQELESPISIAKLMKLNNVLEQTMVTIQLNQQFVNRDDYNSKLVSDGDEVDFLYFMGGGSRSQTPKGDVRQSFNPRNKYKN